MMIEYQVTIKCASGKYRPVSCIVKHEEVDLTDINNRRKVIAAGTRKICLKRYWTSKDLQKMDYTKVLVREYDAEKIAADAKARYDAIKEAKYASGEWKRPKAKE